MGCASSTPVKEEEYRDVPKQEFKGPKIPAAVEAAVQGGGGNTSSKDKDRRGVSFAGDVRDTPSRGTPRGKNDEDTDSPSRAVSVSGRPR